MERLVREKLRNNLNYSEFNATKTAKDLIEIKYRDIQNAIEEWITTDIELCVSEGEYTTHLLTNVYKMTFPAALIFIAWLREEPDIAKASLFIRM